MGRELKSENYRGRTIEYYRRSDNTTLAEVVEDGILVHWSSARNKEIAGKLAKKWIDGEFNR